MTIMGIIGAATGTVALLWNIVSWVCDRGRRVAIQSVTDAWWAVTEEKTPHLVVHCVARFRNRSPQAGSIEHCEVTLTHSDGVLRDWRIDHELQKVPFRSQTSDVGMEIPVPSDEAIPQLRSSEDPVRVDPSAPVDRDICAVCEENIPLDLRPIRLTITCRDNNDHRSVASEKTRHAGDYSQAHERVLPRGVSNEKRLPRNW